MNGWIHHCVGQSLNATIFLSFATTIIITTTATTTIPNIARTTPKIMPRSPIDHFVLRWVIAVVLAVLLLWNAGPHVAPVASFPLAPVHALSLGNVVRSTWRRCHDTMTTAARILPPRFRNDNQNDSDNQNDNNSDNEAPCKDPSVVSWTCPPNQNESLLSLSSTSVTGSSSITF